MEKNKSQIDVERILSPNAAEASLLVGKVGIAAALAHFGAVPGADGAAVALADAIFRPFMGKRYVNFIEPVLKRLADVEDRITAVQNFDNEHFTTVFMQATNEAIKTHEREKIEALQSAVVNTAIGIDIPAETQMLLLGIIGQLSPLHIRLLRFMDNPSLYNYNWERAEKDLYGFQLIVEQAIPELAGKWILYFSVLQELGKRILVIDDIVNDDNMKYSWDKVSKHDSVQLTTPLGRAVVEYITEAK